MKGAQQGPAKDHTTQECPRFTSVAALALQPKPSDFCSHGTRERVPTSLGEKITPKWSRHVPSQERGTIPVIVLGRVSLLAAPKVLSRQEGFISIVTTKSRPFFYLH